MLSLKRLKFNNIGRFVTEQTVDFTGFDKLIQVNGSNLNTGGSSGASKSTMFHAIDYLLGINDIPTSSLQSRLVKAGIYVEGEFDVDGKTLIVERSKKKGLTIKFGYVTVSGNVKLAEERLQEIIGIPKKLFKKMVHKKQKEGGFFLNLTAKESYEFLMNALGLENTGKKTAKIDEDIKEITIRITQLGHAIVAFENSIEEIEELKEFEKEPVCTVKEEDIHKISEEIKLVRDSIGDIEHQKDKTLKDINSTKPVVPIFVDSSSDNIVSLEKELETFKSQKQQLLLEHINKKNKITTAVDDVKNKLSQIPHAKNTIKRLADEMKELLVQKTHIEESKCPTCMQQWVGDSAETKIAAINTKLNDLKPLILEKKKVVDLESELKTQLDRLISITQKMDSENNTEDLDNKIDITNKEIITIKANQNSEKQKIENEYLKKLNDHNEIVRATTETYDLTINPKQDYLNNLQKDRDSKNQSFENYSHTVEVYNIRIAKYCNTLTEKKTNLKDAIDQRDIKAKELSVAEETKRLLKAYTLQIFQDTLDYIGSYSTEILSEIPNMSNATVYFEGCKENKSGTVRDEVNAIINMDGYDNVNIKTLSGGERTVIDLAVDLAVIDMIESKAGKGADFFILDEPFTGLEDINITQCLEVLRQVDTNKKIIIVDHNPIVKEMITDCIMVERDGEQSVVL